MALTADSILVRGTRRCQTSTGWNTAYIGANRHTLPPKETPPADDALHPMAFLVEKGPGAVTRPHFHQADQFQVVVAGHGMLGDREFSDGAVHYTDAYSAYGPIVAGKSGICWCWRATRRSMAAIRCRPIPASSSAQRIPPLPAPQVVSASNCCACNSAAARGTEKGDYQYAGAPAQAHKIFWHGGYDKVTTGRTPIHADCHQVVTA